MLMSHANVYMYLFPMNIFMKVTIYKCQKTNKNTKI